MKKSCPGFTLIELLIAISITTIFFGLGIAKYQQFNRHQALVQATQELKSNLRLAQNKALVGEKPAGCGDNPLLGHRLTFVDNQIYKIVAVCGTEIEVKTGLMLGPNVSKISGPSSILFKVLTRGVEGGGTITLRSIDGEEMAITVTEIGEIR